MTIRSGFPCYTLHFAKDGSDLTGKAVPEMVRPLSQAILAQSITDVIVVSHGWKNSEAEAADLYGKLLAHLNTEQAVTHLKTNRTFVIMEIYWPSKHLDFDSFFRSKQGSGLNGSSQLTELFDQFSLFFKDDELESTRQILQNAREKIKKFEISSSAARGFVKDLQQLLATPGDPILDPIDILLSDLDPEEDDLLGNLQALPRSPSPYDSGGAASTADQSNIAEEVLEQFGRYGKPLYEFFNNISYYQMRKRAYLVGKDGLNPILSHLKQEHPDLKLHLIGHSFGALLVTSAVLGSGECAPLEVDTLTLLQAAFSHFGFAQRYDRIFDGIFRPVLSQVKGPLLISHTNNDEDVRKKYLIASYVKGQAGLAFGDKSYFYGGLGSNGAQKTPESTDEFKLSKDVKNFRFEPKKVYNLNADDLIKGHSDIVHPEVAYAILSAISAT